MVIRIKKQALIFPITNYQPARPAGGLPIARAKPCTRRYVAKRGFTLIEILVVIALFAVVGAVGVDIFLNVIRSSNKANIIAELERNGNVAITMMSTEIRNARSLSSCTGSSCTIIGQDGTEVIFARNAPGGENGYIARNDNPITDTARASGVNVTSLSFNMTSSADAPPVVTITLGLSQPVGTPGRIDYQARTTLTTTVSLRTY